MYYNLEILGKSLDRKRPGDTVFPTSMAKSRKKGICTIDISSFPASRRALFVSVFLFPGNLNPPSLRKTCALVWERWRIIFDSFVCLISTNLQTEGLCLNADKSPLHAPQIWSCSLSGKLLNSILITAIETRHQRWTWIYNAFFSLDEENERIYDRRGLLVGKQNHYASVCHTCLIFIQ